MNINNKINNLNKEKCQLAHFQNMRIFGDERWAKISLLKKTAAGVSQKANTQYKERVVQKKSIIAQKIPWFGDEDHSNNF